MAEEYAAAHTTSRRSLPPASPGTRHHLALTGYVGGGRTAPGTSPHLALTGYVRSGIQSGKLSDADYDESDNRDKDGAMPCTVVSAQEASFPCSLNPSESAACSSSSTAPLVQLPERLQMSEEARNRIASNRAMAFLKRQAKHARDNVRELQKKLIETREARRVRREEIRAAGTKQEQRSFWARQNLATVPRHVKPDASRWSPSKP